MRPSLIALEGPIAAGKTTLAKALAAKLDASLVLEEFNENSFLPDFYTDHDRWALPMQLWFLAKRTQQSTAFFCPQKHVVSDYSHLKEKAMSKTLLSVQREHMLYENISNLLHSNWRSPDLVIYLDAPNDILLGRIVDRGRKYEKDINATFLDSLREAYRTVLAERPTIKIDTSEFDTSSDAQLSTLITRIQDSLLILDN